MEMEGRLRLADVFVTISDPRQPGKVEHDLLELLVVAVSAVLVGADTSPLHLVSAFADDQMRVRTGHAAHNLAVLKQLTLNLIRLDPSQRKGGIKARRLIAASSDTYRNQLIGLR